MRRIPVLSFRRRMSDLVSVGRLSLEGCRRDRARSLSGSARHIGHEDHDKRCGEEVRELVTRLHTGTLYGPHP